MRYCPDPCKRSLGGDLPSPRRSDEVAYCRAQTFKTHTVASRRRADQFAVQGGDLAAFGFTMMDRHGAAREVDPRRHRHARTLVAARQPQA